MKWDQDPFFATSSAESKASWWVEEENSIDFNIQRWRRKSASTDYSALLLLLSRWEGRQRSSLWVLFDVFFASYNDLFLP